MTNLVVCFWGKKSCLNSVPILVVCRSGHQSSPKQTLLSLLLLALLGWGEWQSATVSWQKSRLLVMSKRYYVFLIGNVISVFPFSLFFFCKCEWMVIHVHVHTYVHTYIEFVSYISSYFCSGIISILFWISTNVPFIVNYLSWYCYTLLVVVLWVEEYYKQSKFMGMMDSWIFCFPNASVPREQCIQVHMLICVHVCVCVCFL